MPTLILPPRFSDDSVRVWRAATKAGWNTLRLPGWRLADEHGAALAESDVAVYGEPLFAAAIAEQLGRALLEPPLDWLPGLPRPYLRRELRAGRFADLASCPLPVFAKPADDKAFPARVYDRAEDLTALDHVAADTPVLISEPVHWSVEFRAFIHDGQVAAMSPYARDGELHLAASPDTIIQADRFIHEVLAEQAISLPPAVVVDIGEIRGRGWAVIEANPCFGSGLYLCEARAVLPVFLRALRRMDALGDDRRWVIAR